MTTTEIFAMRFQTNQALKRPVTLTALLCLWLLLNGCQAVLTPEQVTSAFWHAMSEGDVDQAKQYVTEQTQSLVVRQPQLEAASVKTGTIVIDGSKATVATVLTLKTTQQDRDLSFDTSLLKENEHWKIDYRQTLNHLTNRPFGDFFKNLQAIGESVNKALEQQIPLFEKQIESFGEELLRQLDELGRQLKKPAPPARQPQNPNGI